MSLPAIDAYTRDLSVFSHLLAFLVAGGRADRPAAWLAICHSTDHDEGLRSHAIPRGALTLGAR